MAMLFHPRKGPVFFMIGGVNEATVSNSRSVDGFRRRTLFFTQSIINGTNVLSASRNRAVQFRMSSNCWHPMADSFSQSPSTFRCFTVQTVVRHIL